ncbi:hypothetical protein CYY_002139 [Polysphondylium violaceum]|uniref:Uncharacterized protein n=1 Tax=Polysphondylium violaceum TaxID=133409 RepID=A0A8J4V375_9MYCE|nr:hypothetical protein CYY_002139 [Polysphondylium violaceum]
MGVRNKKRKNQSKEDEEDQYYNPPFKQEEFDDDVESIEDQIKREVPNTNNPAENLRKRLENKNNHFQWVVTLAGRAKR